MSDAATQAEDRLAEQMALCRHDPYRFVMIAFPWGTSELANHQGPDDWQRDVLVDIGQRLAAGASLSEVIAIAVASGHGVGKSTLVSWLILWAICTLPDTRGVITANTESQLRTKTWAELSKWYRMCICRHWFSLSATAIYSVDPEHERTWRIDKIAWSEENTEAFAGLHNQGRRIFVAFDEACHDEQTEVLTEHGWRFFRDLTGHERLLTKDQTTEIAEYVYPIKLFRSYRHGEMIKYQCRGADILVTPNHKMRHKVWLGRESRWSEWRWHEASQLSKANHLMSRDIEWDAPDLDEFELPAHQSKRKFSPARKINGDAWMRFLGWWMAEGHVVMPRGVPGGVGITQKDISVMARIVDVCEAVGLRGRVYKASTPQFVASDSALCSWLLKFGRGALAKRLPDCVRMASRRQAKIFLDAFIEGDGYWRSKTRAIMYTSSKLLADDLQEVALKAGAISSVKVRGLAGAEADFGTHRAVSTCDGYVVSCQWDKSHILWRHGKAKRVFYDGWVYCAEVPRTHMLFTRRNGYCLWSGNSAIPDPIWETTEGALTDADTEIIWAVFGNPTRNTGRFRECFGSLKHRWITRQVDSRTVKITNKKQIAEWIADYGEDSDFVRIRVRGAFPRVGNMQFISTEVVERAMRRPEDDVSVTLSDPLVMGVDVARFGEDVSVIKIRRGRDARTHRSIKLRGVDTMTLATRVVDEANRWRVDAIFVDGGGVGGGVVDRLRQLHMPNVYEVQFGGKPDRSTQQESGFIIYANKAAEIWGLMRDWLPYALLPDDKDLAEELTSREFGYVMREGKDAIVLEKKEDMRRRGLASPDDADALALTFAFPVQPSMHQPPRFGQPKPVHQVEYNPLGQAWSPQGQQQPQQQRAPWMPHGPYQR